MWVSGITQGVCGDGQKSTLVVVAIMQSYTCDKLHRATHTTQTNTYITDTVDCANVNFLLLCCGCIGILAWGEELRGAQDSCNLL